MRSGHNSRLGEREPLNWNFMLDGRQPRYYRIDPFYTDCTIDSAYVKKFRLDAGDPDANAWDKALNGKDRLGVPVRGNTFVYFATAETAQLQGNNPSEVLNGNWLAHVQCMQNMASTARYADGQMTGVGASAKECGLGILLTYLCFKDPYIPGYEPGPDISGPNEVFVQRARSKHGGIFAALTPSASLELIG